VKISLRIHISGMSVYVVQTLRGFEIPEVVNGGEDVTARRRCGVASSRRTREIKKGGNHIITNSHTNKTRIRREENGCDWFVGVLTSNQKNKELFP